MSLFADRILDMSGPGDKKPSQALNSMLLLVPQGEAQDPGFLFRQVFLRQLPTEVRTQLAQTTKTGTTAAALRELAAEADKYFSSTGSRIAPVSVHENPLTTEESLDVDVFAISNRGGAAPRNAGGANQSGPRGRGAKSGQSTKPSYTLCYYHARFGENARKCAQPCQFETLQSGNAQPGRKPAK